MRRANAAKSGLTPSELSPSLDLPLFSLRLSFNAFHEQISSFPTTFGELVSPLHSRMLSSTVDLTIIVHPGQHFTSQARPPHVYSLSLQPNMEPSRSIVICPGDIVSRSSLEVRPQDDQAPFAHEPVGTGTLRDVRCVVQLVPFHISPTYYHISFINVFLTPYPNSRSIGRNSIVGEH